MSTYLLAIDQGTTSTRAIIFDEKAHIIAQSQQIFPQHFPQAAWVEHNPEDIWQSVLTTVQKVLKSANLQASDIVAIGISVQRETTMLWNKKTGKALYNAIVWQDRRTAEFCQNLIEQGYEPMVQAKTGLVLDPYFSASKIHWLLENVENARALAEQGELAFGTVDSYLIWRLTRGKLHATDATNASRTMLFNIHTQQWDAELLKLFTIPAALLPEVKNSSDDFGLTEKALFGVEIKIAAVAGDQQCATIGQACFSAGMAKSTYGTGCFIILNTGDKAIQSKNRLLTTIAYRFNGQVTYALEGSIFNAGTAVQWLRDAAHLINNTNETENLAKSIESSAGVYLVPAFTGLGAPYWDPLARGAILGLTRDTGVAHIVRAALEAVCYQTKDLLLAMRQDSQQTLTSLRVDGGMVNNDWLVQFLADILAINVERPTIIESSALGAIFLAGLQVGVYSSLTDISRLWQCQQEFTVQMTEDKRQTLYEGWLKAVKRIL